MTKKHFIALADVIRSWADTPDQFTSIQLGILAAFCQSQNPNFNRDRIALETCKFVIRQ